MKLKLSDEHFCNDHEVYINESFKYDNYITDGIKCYDARVCTVSSNIEHKLSDYRAEPIRNSINEEILKKVLNTKNQVEILPISYNYHSLVIGNDIEAVIDVRQIESQYNYEAFLYKDKIYFFELLEAEPDIGIKTDAYMFVYFLMTITPKYPKFKKEMKILKELNNLAKRLESEEE